MSRSGDSASSTTSLAPGFRFHPTDEELVAYYLKKKVCGKAFRFDCISEIDIYKVEPWELPCLSKIKTRDLEWYFFSGLDRKYGNGSRTNRATLEGYWKTTGKDRPVKHKDQVVGMKKTLVYHLGRAPRGKRSNWVMHEYKLVDEVLDKAGYPLEGYVLCRIFQKSGTGPKNGEQYGAPLEEVEWENEKEDATVLQEVSFEDPFVDDETFIEANDLEQFGLEFPQNIPAPVNVCHEDGNAYPLGCGNVVANEAGYLAVQNQYEGCLQTEYNSSLEALDDQKYFDLPVQVGTNGDMTRNEHLPLPIDLVDGATVKCISTEPLLVTPDATQDDGMFLDAIDNSLDLGCVGQFWDDFDIEAYLNTPTPPTQTDSDSGSFSTDEMLLLPASTQQLPVPCNEVVITSSSEEVLEVPQSKRPKLDLQFPYMANRFLESLPAPPAFAAELPTKEMAARLNAAQSSNAIEVRAGMLRLRDTAVTGSRLQWSFDKSGIVNVLLSFDLPQDASQPEVYSLSNMLSSKMASAVRSWLRSMFSVLFVAASFKMASCIVAK